MAKPKQFSDPSAPIKKTRRGHGEGTAYEQRPGKWVAQITLGKQPNGKQLRKTFSGPSEKDVIAKKTEFLYLQSRGELPTVNKESLGPWLSSWLENYKKHSLRQTTYENYKSLIDTHILPDPIAKIQLQKLKTDTLQDFLRRMAETGKTVIIREKVKEDGKDKEVKKAVQVPLALRCVNLLLFLIKSALDQAQANSILIRNPAAHCQRYKEAKREMLPLDTAQQKALLESLKDHRLYAAFYLALATGARRGEILALKWPNVDLTEGTVKIIESLTRIKGGSKFSEPKTESSKRTIRLPKKALEVLKVHKASQTEEKKKSKEQDEKENITPPTYKDAGLIFCQTNGNKIDPRNFQRTFEIWRDKAELPKKTRLHDLRHTFATMMFSVADPSARAWTLRQFRASRDTPTLRHY